MSDYEVLTFQAAEQAVCEALAHDGEDSAAFDVWEGMVDAVADYAHDYLLKLGYGAILRVSHKTSWEVGAQLTRLAEALGWIRFDIMVMRRMVDGAWVYTWG